MRRPVLSVLISLSVALALVSASGAADLRGRVDALHAYSDAPFSAHNVGVALVSLREGKSIAHTRTGPDGMYYFYGVSPGTYRIEVSRFEGEHPIRFPLEVRDVGRQEIRPIVIRY